MTHLACWPRRCAPPFGAVLLFSVPVNRGGLEMRIGSRPLPMSLPLPLSLLGRWQLSPRSLLPAAWPANRCLHRKRIHYSSIICQGFHIVQGFHMVKRARGPLVLLGIRHRAQQLA